MELSEFCDRLDDRLDHGAYADVDASPNGLQVGRADGREVERVAVAVDGVEATATAAAEAGADLLVVHHGMVWGGLDRVTGREYDRVAALVENDLSLYVSHLPLDGHDELGNAARLADFLDCEVTGPFGELGGVTIGQRASAADPYTVEGLRDRLSALDTGGKPVDVLDFGPDRIEDVGIVTGGGADWVREAAETGVDAFVTGEGKQKVYHEAREAGLNVFLAGHYATETFGVRALADLAESWGLETTFLEHPTGL
ncbi:Nif3-like dinuclear metal center hexameric protein [Natronomonas marina]|jgi:dinuclear metal center YbgI/SA1388 family protein|uniref:Nif3-like dinuclear metal center hexameric protein n=1 Tax=Natronomonas marina TaxID=2961939 RepID=UPI0020C9DDEF|nr:Nif3-like dinuclear metal center hexameric protein [Natronomonas marina]